MRPSRDKQTRQVCTNLLVWEVQKKVNSNFIPFTAQLFAIQLINSIICISVVIKFLRITILFKKLDSKMSAKPDSQGVSNSPRSRNHFSSWFPVCVRILWRTSPRPSPWRVGSSGQWKHGNHSLLTAESGSRRTGWTLTHKCKNNTTIVLVSSEVPWWVWTNQFRCLLLLLIKAWEAHALRPQRRLPRIQNYGRKPYNPFTICNKSLPAFTSRAPLNYGSVEQIQKPHIGLQPEPILGLVASPRRKPGATRIN